ncbi:MAG: hypothetical protein ACRCYU_12470 [Nocardioides sp.]
MNTHWMDTSVKIVDEVRERKAARAARRQLREELATYTTAHEVADLLTVVSRFADEDDEVRQILEQNLIERNRGEQLAS